MNHQTATLEDAIEIAAQAHKGVKDKAGAAYILHPLRMMMRMKTEAEMMTAILHDVVEDSQWTIEKLRERGFSEEVLVAVESVTNREGESYEEFIERAGKNPIARQVKIADLEDNMDIKRLSNLTEKDATRLAKYLRSWNVLRAKTDNVNDEESTFEKLLMSEQQVMKNTDKTPSNLNTTNEQQMPLKANPLPKRTPEEIAAHEALMDRTSKAITEGLHRDNQEIFGEDYLDKKV